MKILSSLVLFVALQLSALAASVTFQWDPSPETNVAYRLYYGLTSRGYAWTTNVPSTNATVQGLDVTNTYYASVTAVDTTNGLESDFSNECILFPGPEGFILATANKRQTVTLTWQQSTNVGVTKYYVYYGKSTNKVDRLTAYVGAPTNTVTLPIPPGTSTLYCKLVASVGDELPSGGFTNASWSAKLSLRWPVTPGQLRLEAAE
jgi:hypothetical protein